MAVSPPAATPSTPTTAAKMQDAFGAANQAAGAAEGLGKLFSGIYDLAADKAPATSAPAPTEGSKTEASNTRGVPPGVASILGKA